MKDLQNRIQQMLADRKNHIRVISMVTALSLLVMFIAPMLLVSPGISLTKNSYSPVKLGNTIVGETPIINGSTSISLQMNNANGGNDANQIGGTFYSPGSIPLNDLLFGTGDSYLKLTGNETLDEALEKAANTYFLGFASDFCAFIDGNFIAKEADSEGRVAVRGDVSFTKSWNYQIGSGNFATLTPLPGCDNYNGRTNYAHLICGGKLDSINTLSTSNYSSNPEKADNYKWHKVDNTVWYDPDQDLYKKLVVGNVSESKRNGGQPYSIAVNEYKNGNESDCDHTYLQSVNQLAQMYEINTEYIFRKVFDLIKKRSITIKDKVTEETSTSVVDGKLVFDASNIADGTRNIYFNLSEWPDTREIVFKLPASYSNKGTHDFNLIVNCPTADIHISDDVRTVFDFGNNFTKTVSKDGGDDTNNKKESEQILYNFYNANGVEIHGNFNGTILAPNADATSPPKGTDECPGHLSGALIAKSFEGYIEFGYRPYRGGSEILGLTSGYVVPVDKFIESTPNHLPGARFTIEKTEDNVISTVGGWVSGEGTEYASLPFKVDFSGDTDYAAVKDYLETQNGSNDTQSKNNISHFSKKSFSGRSWRRIQS